MINNLHTMNGLSCHGLWRQTGVLSASSSQNNATPAFYICGNMLQEPLPLPPVYYEDADLHAWQALIQPKT